MKTQLLTHNIKQLAASDYFFKNMEKPDKPFFPV